MTPYERLAGSRPHDVGIAWSQCQRANRSNVLAIEDRIPMDTAVGRLEDAPGSCANIIDPRITGNSDHRSSTVAHRADVTIFHLLVGIGRQLLCPKRDRKDTK